MLVVVLAAMVSVGCPRFQGAPTDSHGFTVKEREALGAVQDMYEAASSAADEIWPGFDPRSFALLVFRPGGRSFLVNPDKAPDGLDRVELPDLTIPVYSLDSGDLDLSPRLPFAREANALGHTAFMVRHEDGSNRNTWFRLVVHELFHQHQHEHFSRSTFPEQCRYPYSDVGNAFLSQVEDQLLAKLLRAKPDGLSRESFALFVALRQQRYGRNSAGEQAEGIEQWEELVEGTARYVEERYAVEAGITTGEKLRASLAGYLSALHPSDLQKWKYYRTGLTQSLLLDALDLPEWKAASEAGVGPFRFAVEKLRGEVGAIGRERLEQLLADSESIRAPTSEAMDGYLRIEGALLLKWATEGSRRITIVLPERGGAYYVNRGLTFHLEDCSRLATGVISFVDQKHGLEISRKGVSLRNAEGSYRVVFHDDWEKVTIELDGEEVPPEQSEASFSRSIEIHAADWSLSTQGEGEIRVQDGQVQIELR